MDTSPKAQYDKQTLVILSLLQKGEKSTLLVILSEWNERKIHKNVKIHFNFMDTSPKAQYDKAYQYDKIISTTSTLNFII